MTPHDSASTRRIRPQLVILALACAAFGACDGGSAPVAVTPLPAAPVPPAATTPAPQAPPVANDVKLVMPSVFPGARVKFPPLGTFVQGTKRTAYEPGKVYVFEFFATTCGHCAESADAIEAIVSEYTPKGFEFISVTSEDEATVRAWLAKPENAELVKHSLALDPGMKAQRALQDGTFQVQTPRFFAIRDGIVLWFGHPELAKDPFAQILAGTWSPESVRQEFVTNALVARAKNETTNLQKQCEADGKWERLVFFLESMARQIPDKASTFEVQKFGTLIGPAGKTADGYAYGRELASKYSTDISTLRALARTTMSSPWVKDRDFAFALEMAKAADELGKRSDPRAAELMALYYFSMGDREKALENQERAMNLEQDAKAKQRFATQLEKYKKEEPKPVPYAPRVQPGGAQASPGTAPGTAPKNELAADGAHSAP